MNARNIARIFMNEKRYNSKCEWVNLGIYLTPFSEESKVDFTDPLLH